MNMYWVIRAELDNRMHCPLCVLLPEERIHLGAFQEQIYLSLHGTDDGLDLPQVHFSLSFSKGPQFC